MSKVALRRQMGPLYRCTQFGGIKKYLRTKIWLFRTNAKSVLFYRYETWKNNSMDKQFSPSICKMMLTTFETSNGWIKLQTGNYSRKQKKYLMINK